METEIRSYKEICKDLLNATTPKEARKLHKELKAHGSGVPFLDRYPYFPLWVCTVVDAIALLVACCVLWAVL